MKLTWKKTNNGENSRNKKRPAFSRFSNLPFEELESVAPSSQDFADSPSLPQPTVAAAATAAADKTLDDPASNTPSSSFSSDTSMLANSFLEQGNKLAEDGRYSEALGKWEAAITLMPQKAVLHEQKAQVLLEIGDAWAALKAATRATELESSWCEAWITLGRAQLNFGEPDSALESFDKALSLKILYSLSMLIGESPPKPCSFSEILCIE